MIQHCEDPDYVLKNLPIGLPGAVSLPGWNKPGLPSLSSQDKCSSPDHLGGLS